MNTSYTVAKSVVLALTLAVLGFIPTFAEDGMPITPAQPAPSQTQTSAAGTMPVAQPNSPQSGAMGGGMPGMMMPKAQPDSMGGGMPGMMMPKAQPGSMGGGMPGMMMPKAQPGSMSGGMPGMMMPMSQPDSRSGSTGSSTRMAMPTPNKTSQKSASNSHSKLTKTTSVGRKGNHRTASARTTKHAKVTQLSQPGIMQPGSAGSAMQHM